MNNNPNITNEPHVVCYRANDGRLRAVNAVPGYGIDKRFAIYPTRHEANASLRYFNTEEFEDTLFFTVPAAVLFTVKTVEVFEIR